MDSTEYTSILIIDDEIVNLMLFTQYLQKNDFEIIEATTGEKALDILKFSVPDLILLDLGLPGMDGFEVCKIIRQEYSALTLPIIIVTAQEESNVRLQGLQSGANDFIVKPFNAEELLARINIHLDSKKSHQQLEKYHQQLMISHDELEQRVSERTLELLLAKDQAIQANHEKSLFLAKMSHELRTPLNAIIGYSEILLEELDEPDQSDNKTDANHIKKAGTRLLLLINDILDLSK
ncbi:MAG: response regulator, partial [Methylococcales bacterium]|nr:response regulator [Methylococcales bacterium]